MTRAIGIVILLAFGTVAIAIIAARPDWISDSNLFLKNFVNHEFLNVLGVVLAITLASAAQLHLAFNRIEEQYRVANALSRTRARLRQNTLTLIVLFLVSVVVVVIKPIASATPTAEAFFNMCALFVLLWQVLILVSLTELVFAIPPRIKPPDPTPPSDEQSDNQSQSGTQQKTQP
jgi:hypothetical protein